MQDPLFTATLLDWYDAHGRDLPWRRTKDPYAIWLSEIILQQTRIAQGQAYWERFMARFPNVETLAARIIVRGDVDQGDEIVVDVRDGALQAEVRKPE